MQVNLIRRSTRIVGSKYEIGSLLVICFSLHVVHFSLLTQFYNQQMKKRVIR
jgi:hypothetical protein